MRCSHCSIVCCFLYLCTALRVQTGISTDGKSLELVRLPNWPNGPRSVLQYSWTFALHPNSQPCKAHKPTGSMLCEFFFDAKRESPSSSQLSMPTFLTRAVGPAIEPCETTPLKNTDTLQVRCFLRDKGEYELRVMMTYEKQQDAYPSPPRCATPCVCSYLKASGEFPTFTVSDASFDVEPHMDAHTQSKGRWIRDHIRGHASKFIWKTYRANTVDHINRIPPPQACPALHLVGDSHMARVYDFLHARGYAVTYSNANGIHNHYIDEQFYPSREQQAQNNCTGQIFRGDKSEGCLVHYVQNLMQHANGKIVILGAGTWDLRDSSVNDFMNTFQELLGMIHTDKVIYRNAPAYSYKRGDFLKGREMRTNEKLFQATQEIDALATEHGIRIWDSFSITYPRFEESVDTHHYLDSAGGDIGVADVNMLLNMVCHSSESTMSMEFSKSAMLFPETQVPDA